MMFSRVGMAVTTVLNNSQLLRHTSDRFPRARLRHHGIAALVGDDRLDGGGGHRLAICRPRAIGLVAGSFGLLTALAWAWYDWSGRLTEPPAPPEESDLAESDVVDAHWT